MSSENFQIDPDFGKLESQTFQIDPAWEDFGKLDSERELKLKLKEVLELRDKYFSLCDELIHVQSEVEYYEKRNQYNKTKFAKCECQSEYFKAKVEYLQIEFLTSSL